MFSYAMSLAAGMIFLMAVMMFPTTIICCSVFILMFQKLRIRNYSKVGQRKVSPQRMECGLARAHTLGAALVGTDKADYSHKTHLLSSGKEPK